MAFGVTTTGFVVKRLADIRQSMRERLISVFGAQLNTSDDSNSSQFVDAFAGEAAEIWEGMAIVYAAFDPDSAFGVGLENIAKITGITKKNALPSVGVLRFTGTPGVSIPEGTLCRAESLDLFVETTDAAVIGAGGFVDVAASALETGPQTFNANTIQQLVASVLGVTNVTNPDAFILGRNVESDEELRISREASLQAGGSGVDRAIAARLRRLPGVLQAFVYSNRSDITDAFGFPKKSLNAVIWPNSIDADYRANIARILDRYSPAGIGFSGDISLDVTDEYGYVQTVQFRFAEVLDIYLQADLTVNDDYPADGDAQIKDKLVALVNALQVGSDVRPVNLYASVADIPGVQDIVISLKAGSAPGALDLTSIPVSVLQIAQADIVNAVVNSTPV